MPRMDQVIESPEMLDQLIKLLLIGDGKLGKTFYAALAAKFGFNVLYLDGDVGAATIGKMVKEGVLTKEQARRIFLLDVRDRISSGTRGTEFRAFMYEFCTSAVVRWDDTKQQLWDRNSKESTVWELRPARLDQRTVLIMDSWTSYVESLMLAVGRVNGVDIAMASTHEMRPVYQGSDLQATQLLQLIRSMPCHVIALSHPDEFSHLTKPEGKKAGSINEKDMIVDWTKMIPKTTSKPKGLLMPKYFTDVAWLELSPAGNERRLNFKSKNDRVGGGHFDDSKSVDEYSFANLVKAIGGVLPTPDDSTDSLPDWIKIITPEERQAEADAKATKPAESKVLDGTKSAPIKGMGLAAFVKK